MLLTTPERSSASISMERFQKPVANAGQFSLPPLSAILNDHIVSPPRPQLPALNSFATPQTPRYMLPSIRSSSTPAVSTIGSIRNDMTPRILDSSSPKKELMFNTPAISHTANLSMDSESENSINDSMTRPAAKRKHSATTSPTRDFAFISHSPATYPSQEPCIDNASLARRKRRRTSPVELAVLNEQFALGQTPDKTRRMEIAAKVNMTEKAVQIWFQNKRQSLRRLKTSEKEVTELPPTPDSGMLPFGELTHAPPLHASTPLRPTLVKAESHTFEVSPCMAPQLNSPMRSYSAPDLNTHNVPTLNKDAGVKVSLLSKMLATSKDEKKELVMNLTNKKQPEFARQSAKASTQVMTFKLTPKDRKPLGSLPTNTPVPKASAAKDSQCVQSLLSLKVGHR